MGEQINVNGCQARRWVTLYTCGLAAEGKAEACTYYQPVTGSTRCAYLAGINATGRPRNLCRCAAARSLAARNHNRRIQEVAQ